MWAALIIVEPPRFDDDLRLGKRGELVDVQTLVPQASVKRFNEGIFHRFARSNEVPLPPRRYAQSSSARD